MEPAYIFTSEEETEVEVMDWEQNVDGIGASMMEPSTEHHLLDIPSVDDKVNSLSVLFFFLSEHNRQI